MPIANESADHGSKKLAIGSWARCWTGELSGEDRALLEAVVGDLDDGLIGVGGLTGRGYGTVKLTDDSKAGAA